MGAPRDCYRASMALWLRKDDAERAAQWRAASPRRVVEPHRDEAGVAAERAVEAVALVARLALDEYLRGELAPPAFLHGEVDVRRAPGIRHRLDGAKRVAALGIGHHRAVALEIVVARALALAHMVGLARRVALPDLHLGAGARAPAAAGPAPRDVGPRALRGLR